MKKKLFSVFAFILLACFAFAGCAPAGGEDSMYVATDLDIVDFYQKTVTPSTSVAYGAMMYQSEETKDYAMLMMGIGLSTSAALELMPDAVVCVSYFNDVSNSVSQTNNVGYYDVAGILYKVEYVAGKYIVSNGADESRIYQVSRVDGVYNIVSELGVSMQVNFDATVSNLNISCKITDSGESMQFHFETFMLRDGDVAMRCTMVSNSGSNNNITYTIETYTEIFGGKVKFAHAKGREEILTTKNFDEEKFALATTNDIGGFEYTLNGETGGISVRKYGQLA
ncbi:MAG: hypothetical protein IJA69_02245 [Clostridia bacterium]|nr:hypothetical protein [Clostridia bacterium]